MDDYSDIVVKGYRVLALNATKQGNFSQFICMYIYIGIDICHIKSYSFNKSIVKKPWHGSQPCWIWLQARLSLSGLKDIPEKEIVCISIFPKIIWHPLHDPANNAEEKECGPKAPVVGCWQLLHAQPRSGGRRAPSQHQSQLVFICPDRWLPHGKTCFMA